MEVAALGIADTPGAFATRPIELTVLSFAGIEGDRHAGLTRRSGGREKHLPKGTELRNARQLSLVSVEELARIASNLRLPTLDFTWLGANLLLRDAPTLTSCPSGSRLLFPSGAVLVVDGENEPCRKAGGAIARAVKGAPRSDASLSGATTDPALASRFVKAAQRLRGVVAWVERPGIIRCRDRVTLVSR